MGQIRERLSHRRNVAVVLDDDPTGTQTVYDTPVITEWSADTLRQEIHNPGPGFYILTNSRSLSAAETQELHRKLATNLLAAVKVQAGRNRTPELCVISRSNSTLRGHFPVEINTLAKILGTPDVVFLVPFFGEGASYD